MKILMIQLFKLLIYHNPISCPIIKQNMKPIKLLSAYNGDSSPERERDQTATAATARQDYEPLISLISLIF